MEVKDIQPTAEVKYKIKVIDKDGKKLPPQMLKLVVRWVGVDHAVDFARASKLEGKTKMELSEMNRATIAEAILEWDLTSKGQAVPVNDETLKQYVPQIAAAMTVDNEIVGVVLADFVRDADNFLKNS
jgi:GH15 family glucan-1,4-alpha-glucosidase